MSRIWLSPPEVTGEDRTRLMDAVDAGWIAPVGPDLTAFEAEVATVCGRAHGVGLSSGTAALHLALMELGVGPGHDVIVSTFTFAATANAVRYVGARPVFIDADPATWQLSPDLLEEELGERRREGRPQPKTAIVVDLYGQCADYDRILPLLSEYGIPLIEDAAEALGASYRDRPAGCFGEAAVVSFNGNKIITTSGGGMLVTNDDRMATRCRYLSTQARDPAPHYEHTEVGYNYRLSNLLAAFGRGQLVDLDRRVARRREINRRYRDGLNEIEGLDFMPHAHYGESSCWLTCITLAPQCRFDRETVRLRLEEHDIEVRPTWKPMHLQPAYEGEASRLDGTSDALFATGLCLPSGSSLTCDDQDRVITLLREALTGAW